MQLPAPTGSLKVEKITVAAPVRARSCSARSSFELKAGTALGMIGPSGGGKTTLVRALTGIWPMPARRGPAGRCRAGAMAGEPASAAIIGYLPQEVGLLDASVEENISRLSAQAPTRASLRRRKAAGIHEMIVRLPDGYQTQLGPQGVALSAGQRQRIGLARALYRQALPGRHGRAELQSRRRGRGGAHGGDRGIKERGGIAIVVAHRPSALAAVDQVAVIQNGQMTGFGPKSEILRPRPSADAEPMMQPVPAEMGRVSA